MSQWPRKLQCDVTAAMLEYRTIVKKVFWEFDSIIMQNLSDILPSFCTPTWPSHHVSENQEYIQRLQDDYSNFGRKQKSGKNTRTREDTRGRAENQRVWLARMYFARSSISYLNETTCSLIPTLCIMEFS